MSAAARRKGAGGEREAVDLLRSYGWTHAHRNFASGSAGGGDIARGPRGYVWEVKRHGGRLDLPAAYRQACADCTADDVPVVLHRRDRGPWLTTLPAGVLLDLIRTATT